MNENNPKVSCYNEFCKYWDGGERCTKDSISITGPGQFPTCDSFEPCDESEEQE